MLTYDAENHLYFWDGELVPSVTQILQESGLIDTTFMRGGAERGRRVHAACEIIDEGDEPDGLLPDEIPYVEAYRKFLDETGFKPELIEEKVCHETLEYAGTLDRTGILNGERVLLDIKTSQSIARYVGLQLIAYAEALDDSFRRCALQLKKDGTYKIHWFDQDEIDRDGWLGALRVARWKTESKRKKQKIKKAA